MIRLTRINGEDFVLNADQILYLDNRPETYITLSTKDRVVVQESATEVVRRCLAYRKAIRVSSLGDDS